MYWGVLGFWFCGVVCANVGSVLCCFCTRERTGSHACECALEQIVICCIQCGLARIHSLLYLFSFHSEHLPVVLGNGTRIEEDSVHLGSLGFACDLQLLDVALV